MAPQHIENQGLTLKPLIERRDLAAFFSIIQELRPHLVDLDTFVNQVYTQNQEGYVLQGLSWNSVPVGAMGYRMLTTLAWGKILYIDDLVVANIYRGQGFGRYLLDATQPTLRGNKGVAPFILTQATPGTPPTGFICVMGLILAATISHTPCERSLCIISSITAFLIIFLNKMDTSYLFKELIFCTFCLQCPHRLSFCYPCLYKTL